ncbi:PspA/IM30 family protein [Pelagicoccus sp. SDUM812003]|uniref:PspA/IM30 family protein n=1 Tax=Pelagicoccus sp. SDUM812003 TaxID=3041267 RepID=UPI00280DD0FB|nr:PspA/IM30 family protein [Pelagicoccus sp. SDUM812003]MDQ8203952.1 PspA/IM30 family protein [Pelagicoccus sp. SDUM812003]
MKRIKRWTASIVSGFDSVINQVENHESVVNGSLRELHEHAARAKVKLGRLKGELASMKSKSTELEQAREKWTQRALSLRDADKKKALECLRRRRRVETEIERISQELPRHEALVANIENDVSKLEARIDDIRRKKLSFSSRASRAKAMEVIRDHDLDHSNCVDDVFERWEIKLTESEIGANLGVGSDSLEDEFLKEEEEAELERQLEALDDTEKR